MTTTITTMNAYSNILWEPLLYSITTKVICYVAISTELLCNTVHSTEHVSSELSRFPPRNASENTLYCGYQYKNSTQR